MKFHTITIIYLFLVLTNTFAQENETNYARLVNAQLGTMGKGFGVEQRYLEAGYTFPGATMPFGMVQFTTTFFDKQKGFVINQMSGAGCHNMGNLPMLPIPGKLFSSPGDMMNMNPEIQVVDASAGYYKAKLYEKLSCELSTTTRTGMARLDFDNFDYATIIVGTGINSTEITDASVRLTGPSGFEGYADGGSFCGAPSNYRIYFVAEFDTPSSESGTWNDTILKPNSVKTEGANSGVYFTFNTQHNHTIHYKLGISYVSIENARENLDKENNTWNFKEIRLKAENKWNEKLSLIKVSGAPQDRIIQFYSHLYHCFINPSTFNDVNGEYIGSDGEIHKTIRSAHYTAFSNWDTYRTQIQLLSMLLPENASDIVTSHIDFADRAGGGFPRWVLANYETGIMQGDPSSILVANAYAFGAENFDLTRALEIMRKGAEIPGTMAQNIETRLHLDEYLNKGYISAHMGASMMLEYTSADFAIAQFIDKTTGDNKLRDYYLDRSRYWKNIYNPETTWLQSRYADGEWKPQRDDWREASYKNYFWMVPYDLKTLIDTIGGEENTEKRLDEFFTKLNANYHEEFFAAGNEPSFQSPWTYNWIGLPAKTQSIVRRILDEQYSNRDCGLPGNDDMGAMAAWYVLSSIGLYPMVPGVAGFSINSPAFSTIEITLGNGKTLIIKGGSAENFYIKNLRVNGESWNSTWLPFEKIESGAEITFKLTKKPSNWGSEGSLPEFF